MGIQELKMEKMNRKGGTIKGWFFAIIAISMIVIALGIFINEWNNAYSSGLTYDLEGFDKLDQISGEASEQKDSISPETVDAGQDFEATTFRGVFGILNNIYAPFRVVFGEGGLLDSLTDRFGLPNYIRQGIVTMMIIAITVKLVAIIFRLPTPNV